MPSRFERTSTAKNAKERELTYDADRHFPGAARVVREIPPRHFADYPSVEDRMRLVIELARRNVRSGTGGPFGAAVFSRNGRL